MKYLKYLYYIFLFVVIAELLPKEIKDPIPRLWGMIEGFTGIDHTGFAFTPYGGQGNCRIVNTQTALKTKGSKIIFGMITPQSGKSYPHLWAIDNKQNILDDSCVPTSLDCQTRKPFAVIDPLTLNLENKNPTDDKELYQITWGIKYLSGFKKTVSH